MALSNGFRHPLGNGVLTEAAGDADAYHVEANFNWYNSSFGAYHMGEDWNADEGVNADLGRPVYAISNGTVVERGVIDSFGNYLIIRHDLPFPITINGITTSSVYSMYGHFQSPALVNVGDVVGIGQQIGNVGMTGMADANPHVHLEIRLGYGAGYTNMDGYAYGSMPAGWVDPTDFINAYRTLGGASAPLLLSASPADNAVGVDAASNIVLTFNEPVVAGIGNIVIYNSNGSAAQTISITDTNQVNISGNIVTINPTSDLAANSVYYVNVGTGVIKDVAGNSYAGISGAAALNFTTGALDLAGNTMAAARVVTLGSTVSTFNDYVGPTDTADYYKFTTMGATNFALSLNGLTADADVYLLNSSGSEVSHSYNNGTAAEAINVNGLAAGTYYVQVRPYSTAATSYNLGVSASPVSIDLAGNTMAAARVIALGSTVSTFNDYVGPTDAFDYYKFTTTGPTRFALSLNGLTADADVYLLNASGNEISHSYNTGTAAESINISSLAAGTYYVQVRPYSTAATNYTLGVSASPVGDTTAPLLSSMSPADNATSVAVGSNIVLTFNETVVAGSGNIVIYNSNGSVARTIAVTDASQVSISGNTVTINPSNDLAANASYYVNVGAGAIKDVAGNSYAGILNATTFNFATAGVDLAGNTMAAARVVTLGGSSSVFTDYVGPTDALDYYKFTTSSATNFALSLTGLSADADVYLLNSSGKEVSHSYNNGTAAEAINVTNLTAGTYYVQVRPYNSAATNYTLELAATPVGSARTALTSTLTTTTTSVSADQAQAPLSSERFTPVAESQTELPLSDSTRGLASHTNGPQVTANTTIGASNSMAGYHVAGSGDFNGDHHIDLLLYNNTTGGVAIEDSGGAQSNVYSRVGFAPNGSHFANTGDFNGDGLTDLVFVNDTTHAVTVWQMNGANIQSQAQIGTIDAGAGWRFEQTVDLNGDQKTDILFTNQDTGAVALWLMNGTQVAARSQIGVMPAGSHLAGTGDFNGDSNTDLLFVNDRTHVMTEWLMNGTNVTQAVEVGTNHAPLDWHLVA